MFRRVLNLRLDLSEVFKYFLKIFWGIPQKRDVEKIGELNFCNTFSRILLLSITCMMVKNGL